MTVPHIVQPSQNGCTKAAMWGGTGGLVDQALIQDGIQITTETSGDITAIDYNAFKEYFGGSGLCQATECTLFSVRSGDAIVGETWACDSSGNIRASAGFGCFFVEDTSTTPATFRDCYGGSFGNCPEVSAPNQFNGHVAEAMIEDNSSDCSGGTGLFTEYVDTDIALVAQDSLGYEHDYATDTVINWPLSDSNGVLMEQVTLNHPSPDGTAFSWVIGN